jgi:cytoskeleton protein RodZ
MRPGWNYNKMTMPKTSGEEDIMSSSRGPGDRLQAGRIEMGLSVEDVASRMHLSNDIVEAIEENNFNDITAPIFVKGYLRAYARIVSLDEDEMIQQYAEFYSDEDPPISSTSNVAAEISTSDKRVKLITYLVIVGLAVLFAIWWWNKYQTQTDLVSLDAQQSSDIQAVEIAEEPVTETTIETQAPIETLATTAEIQEPLPDTNEEPVDNNALMQVEPGPESEPEAMPALPEAEPEPDKIATMDAGELPESINPEQSQQESEAEQLQESEVPAPVELSDAITRLSPAGSDQLKIVVIADSWVEISDANGHRMLYTLIRANQKFNLTGKAPFTVFFGNGYGVEVTFNGEEVDLISRARDDNTVRLKIGG